jgi:L-arabinonolactonase
MKSIEPKIDLALDAQNHLGETPVWSVAEQALYWVNCEHEPKLQRWSPTTGERTEWAMPERIGGFVFKKAGGLLVTLASGLFDFDPATGELTKRVSSPLPDNISLHECKVDPTGRFWTGSINNAIGPGNLNPGGGALMRLEGDTLVPVIEGISCANGLAFSPDGTKLYFTDSPTAKTHVYDLDPKTGAISNQRLLIDLGPGEGFVDGAGMDAEGGYWPTMVYTGALRRYTADGSWEQEIKLPFRNPTMCTFGGADLDTLYITSMGEGGNEHDGGLYAWKPGVKGLPEPLLAD